ncbi:carbonic anhydrase 14-like [Amphiura filiformis]|uniref:carbonic anhydrase 14-like n=1 Tax=Amphiura filiformis TaxID=82378 RepID=UPI003B21391E
MVFGVYLFIVLFTSQVEGKVSWSYSGPTGPSNWGKIPGASACLGRKQSPININTFETGQQNFAPFVLQGFGANRAGGGANHAGGGVNRAGGSANHAGGGAANPGAANRAVGAANPGAANRAGGAANRGGGPVGGALRMENTGTTLSVTLGNHFITGGGLPNKYKAVEFNLHWGGDNSKGSEHTKNGNAYPAEMHIISYNTLYRNIGEALSKPNGLAMLGFWFTLGRHNAAWDPIINNLQAVKYANNPHIFTTTFPLNTLIPSDLSRFYRYAGSLTTPGCYETVIWTVFDNEIPISRAQIAKLRQLSKFQTPHMDPELAQNCTVDSLITSVQFRDFGSVQCIKAGPTMHTPTMVVKVPDEVGTPRLKKHFQDTHQWVTQQVEPEQQQEQDRIDLKMSTI